MAFNNTMKIERFISAATALDWGSVPDWVVALTAALGLVSIIYQLQALRKSNEVEAHSNRLERLKIILDIDREFEEPALAASRQRLFSLSRSISRKRTGVTPPYVDRSTENTQLVSGHLTEIWKKARIFEPKLKLYENPTEEYMDIMRYPYWLETVGHCCQIGVLNEDDFLILYDAAVINGVSQIIPHIEDRRRASGNKRFLENALWLYEKALARGNMPDS
ncbi:hypothetical protein [Brevundimonas sp.]|uniref:hypothetical protein n=1 Tax=Brevundimonas sp. TaxID=1871086 RepID=UPI002FD87D4A